LLPQPFLPGWYRGSSWNVITGEQKKDWLNLMFKDLDPILHSQLRLAVMSLLISVKEAEFTFLKEKTNSTAGNLSVQIQKLKDAGYIEVVKQFKDNYPQTICKVTKKGIKAFEEYVGNLQSYLGK
jgi:DNA-binding MarR family transcriptional regulator